MLKTSLDATSDVTATGTTKGLAKGLILVDVIAGNAEPMRQVDIVSASRLPRATAVRLLESLCELEVLRLGSEGFYELGPRVAAWGQAFFDRLDLAREASDIVQRLVDLTGETVFLGVRDRRSVLYVSATHSPQAVRPSANVGSRNPLHCTGIGKALLASHSEAERDELLVFPLERRTQNTIVDRDLLTAELDAVQSRGYAVDNIENEEAVRCVAAQVRDHTGDVIAAMSISAPAYRFSMNDLDAVVNELIRAAKELSVRLGYQTNPAAPAVAVPPDPALQIAVTR